MHEGGLLGTYEIRSETGNAGTGMYRRGAYEHGCEFAPIARQKIILPKFLVPLAGFIRIRTRRTVLRLCQSNGKTA